MFGHGESHNFVHNLGLLMDLFIFWSHLRDFIVQFDIDPEICRNLYNETHGYIYIYIPIDVRNSWVSPHIKPPILMIKPSIVVRNPHPIMAKSIYLYNSYPLTNSIPPRNHAFVGDETTYLG